MICSIISPNLGQFESNLTKYCKLLGNFTHTFSLGVEVYYKKNCEYYNRCSKILKANPLTNSADSDQTV